MRERWAANTMKKELGDAIIVAQVRQTFARYLADFEKKLLSDDVPKALEKACAKTRGAAPKKWH